MFIWLLRLLIAFILWRGLSRLLGGIQEGLRGPRGNPPRNAQPPAVPLVRDPICGTYVVPSHALTVGSGGDLRYFCSEDCRRAWVAKRAS